MNNCYVLQLVHVTFSVRDFMWQKLTRKQIKDIEIDSVGVFYLFFLRCLFTFMLPVG